MKHGAALLAALLFCACAGNARTASAPAAQIARNNSSWISMPGPGSLVIFGVSGRQSLRETEINNAIADAARKVAMFYGVRAVHSHTQRIGPGRLDFFTESNTVLEYEQELEKIKDRLIFDPQRDVIHIDGAVFVRFVYPAVFPGNLNFFPARGRDGRPAWIDNRPNMIGGFYAGVGFAARQTRLRDTITMSYESAIVSIVSRISTNVTARETSAGPQNVSFIHRRSEGTLKHFLILETWIDPQNLQVWTLVVAKNAD